MNLKPIHTPHMETHLPLSAIPMLLCMASTAQDPAFDDFERSGGPGPDWTIYFGGTNVTIVYDSDLGLINGQQFGIAAWTGSVFSPDQYCEGVISPDKIDSMWAQVFVRRRTSDAARYAFHWSDRDTVAGYGWWDIKYDGVPSPQTRIVASVLGNAPAAGDTLRLEVITNGSGYPELRGYHNGIMVVTGIDSAAVRIMDGEPGMAFRFRLGWPATWPSKVFEEWNGGSLAGFSTRVDERGMDDFLVWPNPTRVQLNLNNKAPAFVVITDATCRPVMAANLPANGTLPVGSLASGCYTLHMRDAQQHHMGVARFIVE